MRLFDKEIYLRLKADGAPDYQRIVAQSYQYIYRMHWHLCGDRDKAADLTQETFVEAWKSLRGFRGDSSAQTWLTSIALRVWRRRSAQYNNETQLEPAIGRLTEASTDVCDPHYLAERSFNQDQLQAAVLKLPRAQHEAIVLYYMQQMTYQEIASLQNVPLGTVKSRLHEALCRLRTYLDQQELRTGVIMSIDEIERELSTLSPPEEPHDLLSRCLATIPSPTIVKLPKTFKLRHWNLRLAFGTTAIAVLLVATFFYAPPRHQQTIARLSEQSEQVAFADTIAATQQATHWHCVAWHRLPHSVDTPHGHPIVWGYLPILSHASHRHRVTWYRQPLLANSPLHIPYSTDNSVAYMESWFDANHGYESLIDYSRYQPDVPHRTSFSLILPDGEEYYRQGNSIWLLTDKNRWSALRQYWLKRIIGVSPETLQATQSPSQFESSKSANWQGKPAIEFIFTTPAQKRYSLVQHKEQSTPATRDLYFVDPATHLLIGRQSYNLVANKPPQLSYSGIIDYAAIDPARFSLTLFTADAHVSTPSGDTPVNLFMRKKLVPPSYYRVDIKAKQPRGIQRERQLP